MKKCFVILIAIHFSTGNVILPALMKISPLIEHFHQHKMENPAITLLSFLYLHYSDVSHLEKHHADHENLPWHFDDCCSFFVCQHHQLMYEQQFYFQNHVIPLKIEKASFVSAFHDQSPIHTIFQPPRC
ncbi:hypothetical protein COR50_11160 [Chitinophaga caeni]|uniref:Uncharacterized protein n=1 Tax=Chitinophaga caeni TaxID=2029983 RepID=A0A291QUQ1_9BACT|nr:hypothetical protein [Chitinophaga caeni]ATL47680.1 hypothetical protein COR50_11160 [Chitinophaga caeni]